MAWVKARQQEGKEAFWSLQEDLVGQIESRAVGIQDLVGLVKDDCLYLKTK